jgi:hypothetical protein
MLDKESKEYFIPALALEHPSNPEFATLRDKIIFAIRRYYQKGDFSANLTVIDPIPKVTILQFKFNHEKMGYDVLVVVK